MVTRLTLPVIPVAWGEYNYGKEIVVSLPRQLAGNYGNNFNEKNLHHSG